ncbi:MAG: hypothetical protein ACFFCS_01775 [Candidatus Hodarchaeota archaeon]
MKQIKRLSLITSVIVLAFTMIGANGTGNYGMTGNFSTIDTASITDNYTSFTFEDPALSYFNQEAMADLIEGLVINHVDTPGLPFDGAPRAPNAYPPSIRSTSEVVQVCIAMSSPVPNATGIVNWIWSCWQDGYFIDEYSLDYELVLDETLYFEYSTYSPVVATSHALSVLQALGSNLNDTIINDVQDHVLSCYDVASGGFKGSPTASFPTMQNTHHAINCLSIIGRLGTINSSQVASFISGLQVSNGLFNNSYASLRCTNDLVNYHTMRLTRMAVETLQEIGMLGVLDTNDLRSKLVTNFYDPAGNYFKLNEVPNKPKTVPTTDALAILDIIGFPAGFESTDVPLIIDYFSREQQAQGGWLLHDDRTTIESQVTGTIISTLANVAGLPLQGIDLDAVQSYFIDCMVSTTGGNLAAFMPLPASQPSIEHVASIIDFAARTLPPASINLSSYLASVSDINYPESYPCMSSLETQDTGKWRTLSYSGMATLLQETIIKTSLELPYSGADLSNVMILINESQVTTEVAGAEGLVVANRDDLFVMDLFKGLKFRSPSFESTCAALKTCDLLSGFSGGDMFIIEDVFNVTLLHQRIASAYRESISTGWFTREHPTSYQIIDDQVDNLKLSTTRLVLDILHLTGGLSDPVMLSTVSPSKLLAMVSSEQLNTVTDIANYIACLDILNVTITELMANGILQLLQPYQEPGSGWFTRLGLPSLGATISAFKILSIFKGLRVTMDNVFNTAQDVKVHAGVPLDITVELVNFFSGPVQPFDFEITLLDIGIDQAYFLSLVPQFNISLPSTLDENILGPSFISIDAGDEGLSGPITIPLTIEGVLGLEFDGIVDGHEVPNRNPVSVILRLCIVNPLDPSQKTYAHDGDVEIHGLNVEGEFYFPVDEGSPKLDRQSMVNIHPVDKESRYVISATHEHCEPISTFFTLTCDDGTDAGLAVLIPSGLGVILFGGLSWFKKKKYFD